MIKTSTKSVNRLVSNDVLRGFDMLMIMFADRFFSKMHQASQTKTSLFFATQLDHPDWFGFRLYDIITPLLLFLVSAIIPFSMEGRVKEIDKKSKLYPHVVKRLLLFFILDCIVQENLFFLDTNALKSFSNTLHAIAFGYCLSCIAYLHLNKPWTSSPWFLKSNEIASSMVLFKWQEETVNSILNSLSLNGPKHLYKLK